MLLINNHRTSLSTCDVLRAPFQTPRLLVSVRNAVEVSLAIAGGCDILDVKDPSRGSLGMASVEDLRHIVQVARRHNPELVLSAALGEVCEYSSDFTNALPGDLHFVKQGCAGLGEDPHWARKWADARLGISKALSETTSWVAVAYADWKLARAPSVPQIIREAIAVGCAGVLFDTYDKSSGRLLDWMSVAELQTFANQVHPAGMFLAIAGSLRLDDLSRLREVPADIIAIRGAACAGAQRTREISHVAIREFRSQMHACWDLNR